MLQIDNHEPLGIQIELEKLGIPCERKKLEIADYAFSDILIERKTCSDFLSSIYSRRIFDQLYNLKQASPRPLLIVIGQIPKTKWRRIGKRKIEEKLTYEELERRKKTIRANLAICYLSYGIPFYWAENETDFVQFVMNLYFKSNKKISLKPVKRKGQTIKDIKINIFGSIPGIGKGLASKLANNFTIKDFFSLSNQDLKKIEGIGKKRALNILEIINS